MFHCLTIQRQFEFFILSHGKFHDNIENIKLSCSQLSKFISHFKFFYNAWIISNKI